MSPRRADPPTIEYVILGLVIDHPAHGYDLFQRLNREQGLGLIWNVKISRLYALLDKLEGMGWLYTEIIPGEGTAQRKKYRATPAGKLEFLAWLRTPVSSAHRMRQEFLARLFFLMQQEAELIKELLLKQQETSSAWLQSLQEEAASLPDDAQFEQLVWQFRIGQVQAMIDWLDTLVEKG